jgi:hypothetical protein
VASPPKDNNNAVVIASPSPGEATGQFQTKAEGPQKRNVELYTQVLRARRALEVAHSGLDAYRTSYDDEFAKYRASHRAGPNVDLRDVFGQQWFERGRDVTRKIAEAEKNLEHAMHEAAAARISVRDPLDDGTPPGFYDDDDLIDMLVTTVDWTGVEAWIRGVEVGADPDVQPAGTEEEELESMALEGKSSFAQLTKGFRVGNVCRGLRRTLWGGVVKTLRFQKQRKDMREEKRRAYMSISERAYGGKRARIEKWVLRPQGGQHQKS